ncbi:MAG: radical SAM protein [Opitutaceae bacterium]|nr:radical SAM protein [Cytophagales bacterium]
MNLRKLKKAAKRLYYLPRGINFFKYTSNKCLHFLLKFSNKLTIARPSTIMLEVTNHCNLKCITCPREYKFGHEMDLGHMPIEELKKVVDQAYPYIDSIGLTGLGEPLIYKHLEEALQYIKGKNKGIITSLSTNANLPKTFERVKSILPYLDTLQISTDGIGEVYEAVRLRASYQELYNNIILIRDYIREQKIDTDLMFNVVIVKENYKQMAELVTLSNELGISYLNFARFNLAAAKINETSYYELYTSIDFKNEVKRAETEAKKYPKLKFNNWQNMESEGFKTCYFPWSHFYVSWDGFSVPCCSKPFPKELEFGNIFKTGLMNSLNSLKYQDFRKMWQKNETPEFCVGCDVIECRNK